MPQLTRRFFLASSGAALTVRGLPQIVSAPATRRILTLVWDKSAGAMRAVERVVMR